MTIPKIVVTTLISNCTNAIRFFQDKKKRKKYHDFDSAGGDRLNAGDFKAADDTHIRAWPGFGNNSRHTRGSYDSLADREASPSAGAAPIKHNIL